MKTVLLPAMFFLLSAVAVAADNTLDISTLNAHRDQYDGQSLTLHGYVVIGPESLYLVKRLGYERDYWAKDSGCLSLLNSALADKDERYNGKYVEITGVFHADNISYGISLSECGMTGLDIGGDPAGHIKILRRKK